VASYALKGFNAGGYGNLTNQALTKGIEHINPMETLFAGVGGAIISPIALKVGEVAVNKFGVVKTGVANNSRDINKLISNDVKIINKTYAGKTYKLTGDLAIKYPNGVKFTEKGFPNFNQYSGKTISVNGLKGDTYYDFIKANQLAGYKTTPKGFTWHHVEDGVTMMLVPSDIHGAVRHTGGAAFIRNIIKP
jgi:hypothetical protein